MCPSNSAMTQGTTSPPPSTSRSDHSHDGAVSEASTEAPSEGSRSSSNLRTRRRTKTGCLTCRKRRIKCGEERPICANCIKSKRSCEGYARPLTFRDPAIGSSWGPRGMHHRLESHAHVQHPLQPYVTAQSASATQSSFPILAPRPTQPELAGNYNMPAPGPMMWPHTPYSGPATAPLGTGFPPLPHSSMTVMHNEGPMQMPRPAMTWPGIPASEDIMQQQPPLSAGAVLASSPPYPPDIFRYDGARSAPPVDESTPAYSAASMSPVMMAPATDPLPSTGFEVTATYASAAPTPPQEYYGPVDAEDSVPVPAGTAAQLPRHDYGLMLALAASREDQGIRAYDAFLEKPDILATYVPTISASPLMENATARIFCHFITATAPFLSIFERHPVSPYIIFSGREVPRAQQAVWTYVLPTMALSNQTLLQAMLALASLQIARLQNTPPTASMRHYHYALRKIAKAVSSPTKRTAIPTLAATLLLGHFEATTAEHSKWSSHLAGAQQLLKEVDFLRPARQIQQLRVREGSEPWTTTYISAQFQPPTSNLPWLPAARSIDEQLVAQLAGSSLPYGSDDEDLITAVPLTDKDLEDFQIYRDLYWFYVKQDIIQSCISGNALLLPYDSWVRCPPRGPVNKIDHAYGTMDHMLLLMGRVCNFAHKDQARKVRVEAAQTGQSAHSYGLIPGVFSSNMPDAFQTSGSENVHSSPQTPSTADNELAVAEGEWNAIQSAFTVFEQSLGSAFAQLPSDAAPPTANTPFGAAIHYRTQQIAAIWSFFYTARIIALRTHPAMPASPAVAAELVASKTAAWSTAIARIALGMQPPPAEQPLNPSFGAALSESMVPLFFAGIEYKDTAQRTATIERLQLISDRAGFESARLVAQGLEQQWEQQAERGVGPPYARTVIDHPTGILGRDEIEGAALDAWTSDFEHGGGALMSSTGPLLDPADVYMPSTTPSLELGMGRQKSWSRGMLGDDDPSHLPMFLN